MHPIRYVRTHVFKLTQTQFAEVIGVRVATISNWELNREQPLVDKLSRIRQAAADRGLPWNDSWFFEVPASFRGPINDQAAA